MTSDLSGIWKADLHKSRLLGTTPKAVTVKITHTEHELIAEMIIADHDGGEHVLSFRGPTTGEEVTNRVLGTDWRSQLRWEGSELLIESWVNQVGREMHFRDYWSVSNDGDTLTMEHRDDDLAGQITILRKEHEGV